MSYNVKEIADLLDIDFSQEEFTIKDLANGIEVEFEHKDVIGDNAVKSAQIALAHLRERSDYYQGLKFLEEKPKDFWKKTDNMYKYCINITNSFTNTFLFWIFIIVLLYYFGKDLSFIGKYM